MNPIFANLPTSVFEVMSRLARETGRGQSRPGISRRSRPGGRRRKAAEAVRRRLEPVSADDGPARAARRGRGPLPALQGLDLDPDAEVMVTSGATEALAGALLALIEPGDEVVLFQPLYDAYLPLVRRAGGVPRFVSLRPPHFGLTEAALAGRSRPRPRSCCSTIRSIPPRRCFRPRTWRCWPISASASTRSRSATRSGSTSSSTAAATSR